MKPFSIIKIAIIFAGLILILSSLNAITVFSMNTGYEVESLSEEETQKQRSFLKISVKNTPAKGESIVQFDVNDDGKIAVLTNKIGSRKTHISIYSSSGDFLYSFEYDDSGASRCEWDSELLNIYSVRGGIIYSVDTTGSILEIYKVPNVSPQYRKYDNYLQLETKMKGEVIYKMTNNLEFLNYFDGKASKLVLIDPEGETRVIYDSNPDRTIRIVMLAVWIVAFFSMFIMQRNIKAKDPNNSLHWYGKVNTT